MPTFHNPDARSVVGRLEALGNRAIKPYRKMTKKGKATFWSLFLINGIIIAAIIVITPRRIGQWFNDMAMSLREMGLPGMLLISACVVVTSHPPLFGFSACMTLIGFAYGLWTGVVVASLASLMGSALAWFSIRHFFLNWMRRFGSSKNKQWEAFGCVMRDKGWPLVVMIRWCPIPWAIGNGLFASIEGIQFWHYMLANVLFVPRLAIPVFIGSRLNSLSDDSKPDPLRFWLNMGSIALSLCISLGTGTLIYRATLRQMRKMEHPGHPDEGELAAEALESTALLGDFSDDEESRGEQLVPRSQV